MSLSRGVQRAAAEAGISQDAVDSVAEDIQSVAREKGLELEDAVVLPYFDMNGPIVDKESVDYTLHEGVKPAMQYLDGVSEVPLSMLSGWDLQTLEFVADERLELDMDHVGELGGTARIQDEEFTTVDADYAEIDNLRKTLWLEAASEGLTLQEQGNVGPVTGCTYSEGERAGLYNNPVAAESLQKYSVDRFYEQLVAHGADERAIEADGESVIVDLEEPLNVAAMGKTLTREFPLLGFEYEPAGDVSVRMTENSRHVSDKDYDEFLSYFQDFMDRVVEGTVFETEHNPDLSTDYVRSDIEFSKEHGANYRARKIVDGEYVLVNMGDKSSDALNGDNSIFIRQEGMPVMDELGDERVYGTAKNAADYALGLAEAIKRSQKRQS